MGDNLVFSLQPLITRYDNRHDWREWGHQWQCLGEFPRHISSMSLAPRPTVRFPSHRLARSVHKCLKDIHDRYREPNSESPIFTT